MKKSFVFYLGVIYIVALIVVSFLFAYTATAANDTKVKEATTLSSQIADLEGKIEAVKNRKLPEEIDMEAIYAELQTKSNIVVDLQNQYTKLLGVEKVDTNKIDTIAANMDGFLDNESLNYRAPWGDARVVWDVIISKDFDSADKISVLFEGKIKDNIGVLVGAVYDTKDKVFGDFIKMETAAYQHGQAYTVEDENSDVKTGLQALVKQMEEKMAKDGDNKDTQIDSQALQDMWAMREGNESVLK